MMTTIVSLLAMSALSMIQAATINRINLGLVEVTDIDATQSSGLESIVAPGAIALKIVPPGVLTLTVSITASDSWGTTTPVIDVLYMSDAKWAQFKDPLGNPGSVGVLKGSTASFSAANSYYSQDTPQWIVFDNTPGYGSTAPAFSSLTLSWQVSFRPINSGPATPAPSTSCPAGSRGCPCRTLSTSCDVGLTCNSGGTCQTASGTSPNSSPTSPNSQPTSPNSSPTSPNSSPITSPFGSNPVTAPVTSNPNGATSTGWVAPTTPAVAPAGQIDCSDTQIYPQCLNAVFCQTGQKRVCFCDQSGVVQTKSCSGFAFQSSPVTTQNFATTTGQAGAGASCLGECTKACGEQSVKSCDCNGAIVKSFECTANAGIKLAIAIQTIIVAVVGAMFFN